jgi:atypical dual specificity phosphatase
MHICHDFFISSPLALAVHCEAGLGRTGTILAMLLIAEGAGVDDAVSRIRAAQPAAIETAAQMKFLEDCSSYFAS